jgi:hypothetical protein
MIVREAVARENCERRLEGGDGLASIAGSIAQCSGAVSRPKIAAACSKWNSDFSRLSAGSPFMRST